MTSSDNRRTARAAKLTQARATQAAAAARRRVIIGASIAVLAIVAVLGVLAQTQHRTPVAGAGQGTGSDSTGALPGLQVSSAPWAPEYAHLPARLTALALPPNGDESYHIHAHLAVYVDGVKVPVPANVGISMADRLESPTHTHDTSGVIHIEASAPSDRFTLGAFFDLWGVEFTPTQLGGYRAGAGKTVQVYVDGKPVSNGPDWPLHPHDNIVVSYGTPGSSPTTDPYEWPNGL